MVSPGVMGARTRAMCPQTRPGRQSLLQHASSTVGDASDITIPSWTLNNEELCPVDTRGGEKRRRTKWRGRRWSNPLCDNSINSQLFT